MGRGRQYRDLSLPSRPSSMRPWPGKARLRRWSVGQLQQSTIISCRAKRAKRRWRFSSSTTTTRWRGCMPTWRRWAEDTITSSFAGDRSSLGHKTSASSASYEPSSAAKSSSRRKRLPRLIPPGRHCATRKRHSTGASWGLAPNRPERERTPPSQAQPPPPTHTPPHQEPYSLPLARRPTRSHALPPHTQRLAAPPAVRAHPIPHAWHGVSLPIWTRS
mmetsp:Transcript_21462/g.69284  ORF Transcript_21462/g.69284 Transcript_21462/m.69284 type:complete len:218 (+) Transcript_21462:934-1587(+)